jgi:uncharacterized membrane protein
MGKIKSFFRRDSDVLRNIILFIFGLSAGIYKLFFQTTHRINSIIIGTVLLLACVLIIIVEIIEFKKKS